MNKFNFQVLISDEIKYLNWDDTAVLDSMLICQPPERDDRFHRYEEDEDIIRYEGKTNGYFYYQYVNTSKKGSILTEFVEMKEIENVEISKVIICVFIIIIIIIIIFIKQWLLMIIQMNFKLR